MRAPLPALLVFALTTMLAIPAIQSLAPAEAEARPGRMLSESRRGGERQHRQQQNRDNDDDSSSSNRRSSRSERQGTAQGDARPTGRVRSTPTSTPTSTTPRTTTRTTTSTHTSTHVHRRSRPTRTRVRHTSSSVHHHHYHDEPTYGYHDPSPAPEAYLFFGLGLGAFASHQIVDGSLPGTHFNVGLGARGRLWAMELGFDGGMYKFDPLAEGIDLSVMGLSADLKMQPSIMFFEPYAFLGLGGYLFQDGIMQEYAMGAALRMGVGLDFRFDSIALGARYLYAMHGYSNEYGLYDRLGAQTESLTLNASFYF